MPVPIFAALGKALPYIASAFSLYAESRNKPKKKDYMPTGSMYQRYLAHLKSQTSESRVYHQRMRPALRQIGQQTQRGQRQVGYQVARQKPGGGIEAQMRMGINQQALEAIGIASEKASVAQEQVNVRTGEQLMRIGIQEEEQLRRYESDKRRFTQQMFRTAAYVGVNLADTAVRSHIANARIAAATAKDAATAEQAIVKAWENARAVGDFTGELVDFKEGMDLLNYTDPTAMGKHLATTRAKQEKDVKFQENIELEEMKKQSAGRLGEFYIKSKGITDQQEAIDLLNAEFKENISSADYTKAITSIKSLKSDALKPFSMEIELSAAQHKTKELKGLVDKVYDLALTDPNISPSYIAHIAGLQQKELEDQLAILEDNKKLTDKQKDDKAEQLVLQSGLHTLQYKVLGWHKMFTPKDKPTDIEGALKLSKNAQALNSLFNVIKGIDTSKGIQLKDTVGIKKALNKWISSMEISDYSDFTKKDVQAVEFKILSIIDALFKKQPIETAADNNDPLGLF